MSKQVVERLAVEFRFNVEEGLACLKRKVKVPFVRAIEGQCDGLKMNGGLFTQCTNKPMATGELCKTCQKQADASGKPTCGLASEREAEGEAWRDPFPTNGHIFIVNTRGSYAGSPHRRTFTGVFDIRCTEPQCVPRSLLYMWLIRPHCAWVNACVLTYHEGQVGF